LLWSPCVFNLHAVVIRPFSDLLLEPNLHIVFRPCKPQDVCVERLFYYSWGENGKTPAVKKKPNSEVKLSSTELIYHQIDIFGS